MIFILWVLFCIGAYKVSQFERDFTEYDPYAVLEVEKVYRLLFGTQYNKIL